MNSPTLDIVIVSYNCKMLLEQCLDSIAKAEENRFELKSVVVVDNASTDGSAEICQPGLPLKIIKNDTNRGFGAACNQGAAHSDSDYVLFLNPDTRLLHNTLELSIQAFQERKSGDIAVIGVKLLDADGRVSRSCTTIPSIRQQLFAATGLSELSPSLFPDFRMKNWDHEDTRIVGHVIGAFYLIKRGIFEDLEGFDERFFVYYEDLDLSYRVRSLGLEVMYFADAEAEHIGGGTSDKIPVRRMFYSRRSFLQYALKNNPRAAALLVASACLLVEPIVRIVGAIIRRRPQDIRNTLAAYSLLYKWVLGRDRA